jgi:hypothetical protein
MMFLDISFAAFGLVGVLFFYGGIIQHTRMYKKYKDLGDVKTLTHVKTLIQHRNNIIASIMAVCMFLGAATFSLRHFIFTEHLEVGQVWQHVDVPEDPWQDTTYDYIVIVDMKDSHVRYFRADEDGIEDPIEKHFLSVTTEYDFQSTLSYGDYILTTTE